MAIRRNVRIYMDNCCYNRPYDDQTQIRIHLETEAKLYIQDLVSAHKIELVTSYVLDYENSRNRVSRKRRAISDFMADNETWYVSVERADQIEKIARDIMNAGVKEKDALHLGCAMYAKCDYFITTDDRLLKYHAEAMGVVTPGEFIRKMEET